MSAADYWVHIHDDDRYLGAGFLLTRGFVLTALHCLGSRPSDQSLLRLELPDGQSVSGRVCDAVKESDLALIAVRNAHAHAASLPQAPATDAPRADVRWHCRYLPPNEDAGTRLSGNVTHAPVDHRCLAGGVVTALQLQVDQSLGSFAGYSGGPVATEPDRAEEVEGPVVGILLEEKLNRLDPARGSNVLFAATVRHAVERFPQFAVDHLRAVVTDPGRDPARPAAPRTSARESALSGITDILTSLRQWEESGLITAAEAEETRGRTLKRLTDGSLDGPGDGGP
ncbi:trypsin-like peptidase domain-containing protein [Streptomyces sp. NPDC048172]|uniref:trypsin-like peptidase domain-containing protein n=1 Tax=Streptomyces sp. NPDC048172 TaxID=3365505 RepID=UPI00371EEC90